MLLNKNHFMKIGTKLKTLRTAKGFEPIDIAEKLGISKSTYGRYERNETVPDGNMLEKIAEVYEIDLVELLSDEKIILSSKQKGGTSNNALIINQLSDKLFEQYESRIVDLKEQNNDLKERLKKYEN